MAATVAGIHLGPDDHASRPAASSPPVGSFYYCTDHDLLYITDGSSWSTYFDNTGGGGGGDVSADAIWDAAGDLAVGSGADTAARLALGASGKAPISTGSALAYAFPPGYEFDYVQRTTAQTITATTIGAANTVLTGNSVTYDGSTPIVIEFGSLLRTSNTVNHDLSILLYDNTAAAALGFLAYMQSFNSQYNYAPARAAVRLTPAAGARVYSIRAYSSSGNGQIACGDGTSGAQMPGFMRITKA